MVICCYSVITHEWAEQELAGKLLLLPESLRGEALRKRQWADRQLSITGKLLLIDTLAKLAGHLSLADIKYTAHHRPYFDANIDFNIAHSGSIVISCATAQGQIGIDIEQIKPIDFADYTDHFTTNEWKIIKGYPDQLAGFFDFWTRKEAVLKAIGTGFHTPLSSVDVSDDTVIYDDIAYYIQKLSIADGYQCHIATTVKQGVTDIFQLNH